MYSAELVDILNKIAKEYGFRAERAIKVVLTQFSNTGAAVDSVKVLVVNGSTTKSPQLYITFADYLLVLNKSKPQWTTQPNMQKLIDWAKTKRATEEEAKKLAFATAYNQKHFDTWKPKRWRKKSLSEVLKEMNIEILKGFEEALEIGLQQAIKI